jgi:hypothetical protein
MNVFNDSVFTDGVHPGMLGLFSAINRDGTHTQRCKLLPA